MVNNLKNGIEEMLQDNGEWKQTKMASGILHELGDKRIVEEQNDNFDGKQYRVGGTNGKIFYDLQAAKDYLNPSVNNSEEKSYSKSNIDNKIKKYMNDYNIDENKSLEKVYNEMPDKIKGNFDLMYGTHNGKKEPTFEDKLKEFYSDEEIKKINPAELDLLKDFFGRFNNPKVRK